MYKHDNMLTVSFISYVPIFIYFMMESICVMKNKSQKLLFYIFLKLKLVIIIMLHIYIYSFIYETRCKEQLSRLWDFVMHILKSYIYPLFMHFLYPLFMQEAVSHFYNQFKSEHF